jgi:hypothetical protein
MELFTLLLHVEECKQVLTRYEVFCVDGSISPLTTHAENDGCLCGWPFSFVARWEF